MPTIDTDLAAVIDAYRTCEFATLTRDGTPATWPAVALRRPDGTLLLTTSPAFPQKAFNIRRDARVALLFSDPTGSGLEGAPQILLQGTAVCADELVASPEGLEDYWARLFERQPESRAYLGIPARWLLGWYYLRLLITVTPSRISTRPPAAVDEVTPDRPRHDLAGADVIARRPTAVLGAQDTTGAPVLARTRPVPTAAGYTVEVPDDVQIVAGPAGLLVHQHDENLADRAAALVRGTLSATPDGTWLLTPGRVVEPGPGGTPREQLRTLRHCRRATRDYLARRGLPRPRVRWDLFQKVAAQG